MEELATVSISRGIHHQWCVVYTPKETGKSAPVCVCQRLTSKQGPSKDMRLITHAKRCHRLVSSENISAHLQPLITNEIYTETSQRTRR